MREYIVTQKIRQQKTLLKNTWFYCLVYVAAAVAAMYYRSEIGVFLSRYDFVVPIVLLSVFFYLGVFRRYPMIFVNPATLFYAGGTKVVKQLIVLRIAAHMVLCALMSFVLFLVSAGSIGAAFCVNVFISLIFCSLLGWSRNNRQYGILFYLAGAITTSGLLVFDPSISILVNTGMSILLCRVRPAFTMEYYFNIMREAYAISTATARGDMAVLQRIVYANKQPKEKTFKGKNGFRKYLFLKCPLLYKGIFVDTARTRGYFYVFVVAFVIAALLVFSFVPVGPVTKAITATLLASSLSTIISEYSNHAVSLAAKAKKGLFIPLSIAKQALFLSIMPCAILTCVFFLVALLFKFSIIALAIGWLFVLGVSCARIYVSLLIRNRFRRTLNVLTSFLLICSLALIVC